jgi:predicted RNA polymerase sigma factor
MRYLCLLYVNEDTRPGPGTPEFGEVAQANVAATKELADDPRRARWAPLHVGRADVPRRLGRTADADAAVRDALADHPSPK